MSHRRDTDLRPEEAEQIIALRTKRKLRYRDIADLTGRSVGTVCNVLKGHTMGGKSRVVKERVRDDAPRVYDPVADEQARTEKETKHREIRDAVKELAFRDWLDRTIQLHVPPVPRIPPPTFVKPPRKAHARFPLLVMTDWHFEEKVLPTGVLGLNSYDIATACARVYRIVHSVIDWKRDQEVGGRYAFPTLTVLLNGDFLTGDLHGSNKYSDSPNTVRAALSCGDLLAVALADLARAFPEVNVIGTYGNHGRMPHRKKVPTKDPTESWDYLAYQVARRRLSGVDNITWELPSAYGVLFKVGGQQCYAAHGNFIPNNLGVVGYGVRRFTSALASNLSAAGSPLKYAFFGHWHQSSSAEFAGIETFIGPSLIGTQEYSFLQGGAVNRSAQEMHVFDTDLGHVSRERFYGDSPTGELRGTYTVEI